MTLSPEERAAAVVHDYFSSDLDIVNGADGEKRTIEALIAKAIREACNEKLEEAAARLRLQAGALLPPGAQLVAKCAETVRSFKLKDTSP